MLATPTCALQAHQASLQRKLQERQADVHAQQQELAATERVRRGGMVWGCEVWHGQSSAGAAEARLELGELRSPSGAPAAGRPILNDACCSRASRLQDIEALRVRIAAQPMNQEDVLRMNQEK